MRRRIFFLVSLLGAGGCAALGSIVPVLVPVLDELAGLLDLIERKGARHEKVLAFAAVARDALEAGRAALEGLDNVTKAQYDRAMRSFFEAYKRLFEAVQSAGLLDYGTGKEGLTEIPDPETLEARAQRATGLQ